ncbi:hypothetical protein E8E13_000322 [Curvularia kusanoi]|uniref:Uncharacterized protein n=1 Tax=Curvularia kusanoi TaxID=90978 RepID=A0A9P4W6D5_CURKU|nr:hypothetical protein E8E13_000322 [Curvularia kusanoi]
MYSVRNVLVTIALICVVPFSLGAPTPTQVDTVTPHSIKQFNHTFTGHGLDATGAPSLLEAGAVTCGVTSRPGHDCAQNVCPPDEQCKVSDAGATRHRCKGSDHIFGKALIAVAKSKGVQEMAEAL